MSGRRPWAAIGLAIGLPIGLVIALGGCAAGMPVPPPASAPLHYLGLQELPAGTQVQGQRVGGLSALDLDPVSGCFVALSDDGGRRGPVRLFVLALDLTRFHRAAEPGADGVRMLGVTRLVRPDGSAYGRGEVDPEGLRVDARRARLLWSDEGGRQAGALRPPVVRAATRDGRESGRLPLPQAFEPGPGRGARDNFGFEALALTPDGAQLIVGVENALEQDDATAAVGRGSRVRLIRHDASSGAVLAQHVYEVDPLPWPPLLPSLPATNGLSELLALDAMHLIALERAFAAGSAVPGAPATGFGARLYLVDLSAADDVSALDSLRGRTVTPARKTLLLDLTRLRQDDGSRVALDNLEGLSWGPWHDGRPTLVLVSDDNFSGRQVTQFVALAITGPLPGGVTAVPPPSAPACDPQAAPPHAGRADASQRISPSR